MDMTSAPGPRKPITAARGRLTRDRLRVERLVGWTSWAAYEGFLAEPGPWVAAVDHPFGLPRATVAALGWPAGWEAYIERVDAHPDLAAFRAALVAHRRERPPGDKYQFRAQDRALGAASPVNTQRPPVALMFYESARRLARAEVDVRPCRPRPGSDRVVLEGYPRLVADRLIGRRRRYKDGAAVEGHVTAAARAALLDALAGEVCREAYGVTVQVDEQDRGRIVHDWSGDLLDAVLCLAQAAWAHGRGDDGYGVPAWADPAEGWIVDPSTAADGSRV